MQTSIEQMTVGDGARGGWSKIVNSHWIKEALEIITCKRCKRIQKTKILNYKFSLPHEHTYIAWTTRPLIKYEIGHVHNRLDTNENIIPGCSFYDQFLFIFYLTHMMEKKQRSICKLITIQKAITWSRIVNEKS